MTTLGSSLAHGMTRHHLAVDHRRAITLLDTTPPSRSDSRGVVYNDIIGMFRRTTLAIVYDQETGTGKRRHRLLIGVIPGDGADGLALAALSVPFRDPRTFEVISVDIEATAHCIQRIAQTLGGGGYHPQGHRGAMGPSRTGKGPVKDR